MMIPKPQLFLRLSGLVILSYITYLVVFAKGPATVSYIAQSRSRFTDHQYRSTIASPRHNNPSSTSTPSSSASGGRDLAHPVSHDSHVVTSATKDISTSLALEAKPQIIGKSTKVIFQPEWATPVGMPLILALNKMFERTMKFESCEFSNCVFSYSSNLSDVSKADVVLLRFSVHLPRQTVSPETRRRQLWIVHSHEPPGLSHWTPDINSYNGTMTNTQDSTVFFPFGETIPIPAEDQEKGLETVNYAKGKNKGAYAYVSNCGGLSGKRIQLMKALSRHIDVDIFGKCSATTPPCARGNTSCEASKHSEYRFYLAFENSMCRGYITEKFWKTLASDRRLLPVAIGGLSTQEYTSIAPPDSFLHAYNFSSIDALGRHLRLLMDDDAAYNRYHHWRQKFYTTLHRVPQKSSCRLCELANNPDSLKSTQRRQFANEFNSHQNCKPVSRVFSK